METTTGNCQDMKMNECVHWPTCSAQHCDIDRKQKPGQGEIATRKAEGGSGKGNGERRTETNTRTRQGNLIQSKTKLDTDRRWLCVLRSDCDCRCDNATKTQPSDSCGQARGAPLASYEYAIAGKMSEACAGIKKKQSRIYG